MLKNGTLHELDREKKSVTIMRILRNPLFPATVSLITYFIGFITLMLDTKFDSGYFWTRVIKYSIRITPYICMFIYSLMDKTHRDNTNPRRIVFITVLFALLSYILTAILLETGVEPLGLYRLLDYLEIERGTFDTIIIIATIIMLFMIPYIRGRLMIAYSIIISIIYIVAIGFNAIMGRCGYLVLYPDTVCFLLAIVLLQCVMVIFASRFNCENIGGCWDCLFEYDMHWDEEEMYEEDEYVMM